MTRKNLRVEMHATVDRLIIEGGRAVGVRFSRLSEIVEARTEGEVILSAGAIGSPHILSLSGIGRPEWLTPLGIPVLLERRGVGSNLQDHLQLRAIYRISNARTLNEMYHSPFGRARMAIDYLVRRRGPLTMAPSQLGIFMRSTTEHPRANLEFHVQPLSLDKFGDPLHTFRAITVSACNLRPTSRGLVRPRSADPRLAPAIAPNYLSTLDDRQVAADAIRATRRLMRQAALERFGPIELLPGPQTGDDIDSLATAAGEIGTTIFHPVGTAKMGLHTDPESVVDAYLRVHRIDRLRVADASIMPTITSGNTNTPTAMIAQRAADMILAASR